MNTEDDAPPPAISVLDRGPQLMVIPSAGGATHALTNLRGGGGTEMMKAIKTALGPPFNDERIRIVSFVTDGYIGNDFAILDEIQKTAGTTRVFPFGIGNSVNRFLIEGMAREGRGEAEIVPLASDGDQAAERFYERVHSPVLTDITVETQGVELDNIYPNPELIPDLFSAKPLVLTGQYTGAGSGSIIVRGNTAAGPFERTIDVSLPKRNLEHDVLAALWARKKIDGLMAQDLQGLQRGTVNENVKKQITQLGIEFDLMTQFTSFVAVEERVVNENGTPKTVDVPVEMPDGVSYEGVFGDKRVLAEGATVGRGVAFKTMAQAMPAPAAPRRESISRRRGGFGARTDNISADAVAGEPVKPSEEEQRMDGDKKDANEQKAHPKLAPVLQQLLANPPQGNYRQGDIEVQNGAVKVYIHLATLGDTQLQALRALGIDIESVLRSNKIVLAEVPLAKLRKVADLAFVTKITPPTF